MSLSGQLKLYCDKFKLDFPEFKLENVNLKVKCHIIWYNQHIVSGDEVLDYNTAIISAINKLSEWVNSDENFINLLMLQKQAMKT